MADHILVLRVPRGSWYDLFVTKLEAMSRVQIIGEYILPTEVCTCERPKGQAKVSDWEKGKMSGVPVCKACRKPSPVWARGILPRLQHALGINQREG